MAVFTSDFSECYTIQSDPIAASVIEEKYLWWPAGVKWPPSPPTLVEASTAITVVAEVCFQVCCYKKNPLTVNFVTEKEDSGCECFKKHWLSKHKARSGLPNILSA